MKLPAESSSSWVHVGFAVFTWASLNAWSELPALSDADRKELASLAGSLRTNIDSLVKEARETQDALIFARPEAQAKQNAWLVLLKRVASESLAIVTARLGNSSKDHPLVREFLPDLLGSIVTAQRRRDDRRHARCHGRARWDARSKTSGTHEHA